MGALLACVAVVAVVGGLAAHRIARRNRPADASAGDPRQILIAVGEALQQEADRAQHEVPPLQQKAPPLQQEADRAQHEVPPLQQKADRSSRWGSRRQEDFPDPARSPGASGDPAADPERIRNQIEPEFKIEPKILIVGIDGGGTEVGLEAPVAGWPPRTSELMRSRRRTIATIADVEVRVRPIPNGVHLHVPGLVLLAIHLDHARLVMPSAALDLQGDVADWLERWIPWATRVLGVELGDPPVRWETQGIDAHIDAAGLDIPDAWIVHPDAWSGRSARRTPCPDGYDQNGRLLGGRIGNKADGANGRGCDTSLYFYLKTAEQAAKAGRTGTAAFTASLEAALRFAYPHVEDVSQIPVWRFEASLRGRALDLRADDGEWCLRDPWALADPRAIAAALAYVFGVPAIPTSGVIRLTDERERDRPPKKRNPHPLWLLLREAAAAGPKGRIVQAREARRLELGQAQERAARRASRALGQLAGAAGEASTPIAAAEFAAAIVPHICQREDWAGHVSEGRVAHAVLHEPATESPT